MKITDCMHATLHFFLKKFCHYSYLRCKKQIYLGCTKTDIFLSQAPFYLLRGRTTETGCQLLIHFLQLAHQLSQRCALMASKSGKLHEILSLNQMEQSPFIFVCPTPVHRYLARRGNYLNGYLYSIWGYVWDKWVEVKHSSKSIKLRSRKFKIILSEVLDKNNCSIFF